MSKVKGKGKGSAKFKVGANKEEHVAKKYTDKALRAHKKKDNHDAKLESEKALKRGRGVMFCSDHAEGNKLCTREFNRPKWLKRHVQAAMIRPTLHVSGTRGEVRRTDAKRKAQSSTSGTSDTLKKLFAASTTGANAVATVNKKTKDDGTELGRTVEYTLLACSKVIAVEVLPIGYACKPSKRGAKKKYTSLQLTFLKWCYEQGVKDKAKKLTAEATELIMEIHGTQAGQMRFPHDIFWGANANGIPTFGVQELLDVWVIKPWFSQQKGQFDKAIAKALAERERATTATNSMNVDATEHEELEEMLDAGADD